MPEQHTPWRIRGSYALSDVPDPVLVMICARCERRGRYNVARLMAAYGDLTLPDLITRMAAESCEVKDGSGRCGLTYEAAPGT